MLSFANPSFLFALIGLVVPIVAHLINRERAQPITFPSLRFILRARLPKEGKRSLGDLLLLLLRILFLAAIILLLAGPEWIPEEVMEDGSPAGNENVVFVIDTSSSMSGWGSWESAQNEFKQRLDALPDSTKVGLIMFSLHATDPVPLTTKHQVIEDLVMSATPENSRGQPMFSIHQAVKMLGDEGQRRIIIISDFQLPNWQSSRWSGVDPEIEMDFVKVGDFGLENLAVLSANAYSSNDNKTRVVARVKNFSSETVERIVKVKTVDGEFDQVVKFSPGQTQRVAIQLPVPGNQVGRVILPSDTYLYDNEYLLWMGAAPPINLLTVIPMKEEPQKIKEVGFVGKALSVNVESAFNRYAVFGSDTDIGVTDLFTKTKLLYFPGSVPYLSKIQLEGMREFLEDGGVVIVTPGKSSAKQFRALRSAGISDVAYVSHSGSRVDRRSSYHVGWINPQSTLAEIFDEDASSDLYLTEIHQYIRLRAGKNTEVLLKTETGDPLLMREKRGEGTIIISAMAWDAEWSDLPLRFSFLPMLRELLDEVSTVNNRVVRLECGAQIPLTYLPQGKTVNSPDIASLTAVPDVFGLGNKPFEVNVSREESIPKRIVLTDLRAQLYYSGADSSVIGNSESDESDATPLWHYMLMLAYLLVMIEVILAGVIDTRLQTA